MKVTPFIATLPSPKTPLERRMRLTFEREIAKLETALAKPIDVSKTKWGCIHKRLPGYTASDWRAALATPSQAIKDLTAK